MRPSCVEKLSQIISRVDDDAELNILLEGLLTPHELEEAMTRWQLLVMLETGVTQRDIAKHLGISLGKIARGSRLLKYGPTEFERLFRKIAGELGDL
ncbi:MAG: Trp family transcriptional regulator [Lentisphaeria bacterium]|nr:Trp family transcriptional regulator [Lentisphaeria bacterium]